MSVFFKEVEKKKEYMKYWTAGLQWFITCSLHCCDLSLVVHNFSTVSSAQSWGFTRVYGLAQHYFRSRWKVYRNTHDLSLWLYPHSKKNASTTNWTAYKLLRSNEYRCNPFSASDRDNQSVRVSRECRPAVGSVQYLDHKRENTGSCLANTQALYMLQHAVWLQLWTKSMS